MNLNNFPVGVTDWSQIPASVSSGETGTTKMRTRELGNIQLRLVEYSAQYVADHWCHKGHIVFVVSGRLVIEHLGGATYALTQGTSYHVPDGDELPHRVCSADGATIFVVD
jgi:hypothetical protein